jgi:hypothetical protein
VHAHFFIPDDRHWLRRRQGRYTGPKGTRSPELALAFMDAHRIQMKLLSFSMQLPTEDELLAVATNAVHIFPSPRDRIPTS